MSAEKESKKPEDIPVSVGKYVSEKKVSDKLDVWGTEISIKKVSKKVADVVKLISKYEKLKKVSEA